MFMGEYNHTIDAKGRLIIPAKFREPLGEEFVLTRGLDGCLYIYPMDEWEAFEEKLRALPLTNKDARAFSRFFVAGATTCELDKQGRILVPQTLREFAGLEKDVILAGNLSRVEVWSKEKWSEPTWRTWESSSEHKISEKSNRRRKWNLNTNLYYWTRPLAG